MTKILVTFHTHEGQTAKIAERIAERLHALGCVVDVVAIGAAPGLAGYDGVVVGDSIRLGRHSRQLVHFLRRRRAELARLPVAVFQVSMTSATSDATHDTEAARLLQKLLQSSDLRPVLTATFAGALRYQEYGWVTKHVMRSIAKREGNATDTSRDHEYTDWDAVEDFAAEVAAAVRDAEPIAP